MGHKHSWSQGTGQSNDWPQKQWDMHWDGVETRERLRDAQFGAQAGEPIQAAGCFLVAVAGVLILAVFALMAWVTFGG
jgi:hypothetical protein